MGYTVSQLDCSLEVTFFYIWCWGTLHSITEFMQYLLPYWL